MAERIICAVRLSDGCRSDPALYARYGELAAAVRDNAPKITYENGMRALPVDFRRCRSPSCGDGPAAGRVARTLAGLPVVAFTHVIDCRDPALGRARGFDCSGERAGRVYIQYWTYYADSATLRGLPYLDEQGYHHDDWEGYQLRINPDGSVDARASSHSGYNGQEKFLNKASDAAGKLPGAGEVREAAEALGLRDRGGWTPSRGTLYVSGGSHAGHASEDSLERDLAVVIATGALSVRPRPRGPFARHDAKLRVERLAGRLQRRLFGAGPRTTPSGSLTLIPIEPLAGSGARFAVSPPWRKRVYRDPEYEGTG